MPRRFGTPPESCVLGPPVADARLFCSFLAFGVPPHAFVGGEISQTHTPDNADTHVLQKCPGIRELFLGEPRLVKSLAQGKTGFRFYVW